MLRRNYLIALAIVLIASIGWYMFRPERLFINATVHEDFPEAGQSGSSTILSQGEFHDGAHKSKGTATIYKLANGKRVLRFTNFETSNGPDLHVYLVAAQDAKDSETVKTAGFIDLAKLKGNVGEQNYEVPADVDLVKYRAVTVWCQRFGVNFGTAPLMENAN